MTKSHTKELHKAHTRWLTASTFTYSHNAEECLSHSSTAARDRDWLTWEKIFTWRPYYINCRKCNFLNELIQSINIYAHLNILHTYTHTYSHTQTFDFPELCLLDFTVFWKDLFFFHLIVTIVINCIQISLTMLFYHLFWGMWRIVCSLFLWFVICQNITFPFPLKRLVINTFKTKSTTIGSCSYKSIHI